MAKTITRGLVTIKAGAIAGDGGMGTSLAQYGDTVADSCTVTVDDPETTEFLIEESDLPIDSSVKSGKTVIQWQVANPDADTLVKFAGGTKIAGPPELWEAPSTMPAIELSLEITPTKGYKLEIPRASIVAKYDGAYSKKELKVLTVKATILAPTKAGVAPMKLTAI